MKRFATHFAVLAANAALASTVFAGAGSNAGAHPAAPAPRAAQTASTSPAFGAAAFAGFVQAKGARPDSAVQGAVKVKLINEYAQAAVGGTASGADVATMASLLPAKNAAMQGMMVAGQNNVLLMTGLATHK